MSNKHTAERPSDPLWWHNQSRTAHPDNCPCPGCKGARKARGKEVAEPKQAS